MDPLPQPKKRALHGYKYTPKEQAEKEHYIKQMIRDFPDTPGGELMCEWVYDFEADDHMGRSRHRIRLAG